MLVAEAVNNLSKFKINLSVLLVSVFAIQWCLLKPLTAAVFSPEYAVFSFIHTMLLPQLYVCVLPVLKKS